MFEKVLTIIWLYYKMWVYCDRRRVCMSKVIEKDKALERRFQPVNVLPPNPTDAIEILKGRE